MSDTLDTQGKPYWSWPLDLVTLWMPHKQGIHPALRGITLATLNRDEFNQRHVAQAEALGRKTHTTTAKERTVDHNGGVLPLRERAIFLGDVLDQLDGVGYWGRMVHEEGKGDKVEIRTTEPYPTTTGVIPTVALEAFVADMREKTVAVRALWINPDQQEGRFFANLVVSTRELRPEEICKAPTEELPDDPEERRGILVNEDELFAFVRDGMPRLGSEQYRPRKPDY